MKFLIIIFLNLLFSQDINADPFSSGATTGSIGTVTINDEVYNQLSLRPEVPLGKLKVGLDIYFYFNDDGIYWDSWNFTSMSAAYKTIVDKIYYLRWGEPDDNKETVTKSSIKQRLFFNGRENRQGGTSYEYQVDVENDIVVGWKNLE